MVISFYIAPLFVPADRPDRFAKDAMSGADAIIIDLEDAVAPNAKVGARAAIAATASLPKNVPIIVRVNGCGTPWHLEDIACVASLTAVGVMLPETERGDDIVEVSKALPNRPLFALMETARGMAAAREIGCVDITARLGFGSMDFSADLGCAHTREALVAARSELVLASRLCGLPAPIDGVTTALDDGAVIESDARYAAEIGFGGKLCIHPRQVASVYLGFAPSGREIAWARRILAAQENGAVAIDGYMVDAPVRGF